MIPPIKPNARVQAAQTKSTAATNIVTRLQSDNKVIHREIAAQEAELECNAANLVARAEAAALGKPFAGKILTPSEVSAMRCEIEGKEQAAAILRAQLPGAQANSEKLEREANAEIGRQLGADVIPPLLEAAQASCAAAVRDLAALAAVEDRIINQYQARPPVEYVPGNAARFLTGMINSGARNVFCDFGSGRGAWDVPGYSEHSTATENAVRALEAAAREALA